jgi:tetratricopeptide (TPR) repeat protein
MNAERKSRVNELLGIARAHRQSGDASAALAAFEAAAEIDAGNRAIEVEVVHELGQLSRFEEAEARLSGVLAREPANLPALVEAGRLAGRRSRFGDAVAAFQAAAIVSPAHAGIQIEIARNLRFDNRLAEAEAVLDRLIAGEPSSASALIELGLCRRLRNDHAGALAAFGQAGAVDPSRPGPRLEAASELHALGRTGEAENVLRALIADMPKAAAAVVKLAYFVLKAGRLDEADDLFDEASRLEPRNPHHALTRGRIALRRGDRAAALGYFESAVRLAPANLDARLALAAELREQGRVEEAAARLREAPGGAVDACPHSPSG